MASAPPTSCGNSPARVCCRSRGRGSPWTCPALTDSLDRLNGLRGVDGGGQQTAPVVSGRVQARGGGRSPRWPLGFGGGGRALPAGPAGEGLGAPGGGAPSGRGRGGRRGPPPP